MCQCFAIRLHTQGHGCDRTVCAAKCSMQHFRQSSMLSIGSPSSLATRSSVSPQLSISTPVNRLLQNRKTFKRSLPEPPQCSKFQVSTKLMKCGIRIDVFDRMTWRRWAKVLAVLHILIKGAKPLELKCGADHNCNMLPDMADPANLRHLKCVPGTPQMCAFAPRRSHSGPWCCAHRCGACQLAAVQLAHAVIKKEAALQKRMSEEAGAALLERYCEKGGCVCECV